MNYSKRIIKECQQYIVKSQFRRNKSGIYCFDQKKNDKKKKTRGQSRGRRYNTKASRIIRFQWLTSLSVDICFIYYSVSELNMPSPRVVPKCKGNYKNGPRVHCFSFPKSKHLFEKWKHAIKRENFTPSPFSKVSS